MKLATAAGLGAILLTLHACSSKPPAPVEVTVASAPSGATILFEEVELGQTPFQLRVSEQTEITVTLEGHEPQTVTATARDPKLIVRLVPLEETSAPPQPDVETRPSAPVEVTVACAPSGATILFEEVELGQTPFQLRISEPTEITVTLEGHEPQTVTATSQDPKLIVRLVPLEKTPPAVEKRPSGPVYDTVAKAQAAVRSGRIDRVRYNQIISQLKARRATQHSQLRALYRKGKIDQVEYRRRRVLIDSRYQGN